MIALSSQPFKFNNQPYYRQLHLSLFPRTHTWTLFLLDSIDSVTPTSCAICPQRHLVIGEL